MLYVFCSSNDAPRPSSTRSIGMSLRLLLRSRRLSGLPTSPKRCPRSGSYVCRISVPTFHIFRVRRPDVSTSLPHPPLVADFLGVRRYISRIAPGFRFAGTCHTLGCLHGYLCGASQDSDPRLPARWRLQLRNVSLPFSNLADRGDDFSIN